MPDQAAMTALLFNRMIMRAEQALVKSADADVLTGDELKTLVRSVGAMYDQRRIAFEDMMLLPFHPAHNCR